ncbi:hypothetical protein BDV10DRAFT_22784 [Aspergillus recurvatus]
MTGEERITPDGWAQSGWFGKGSRAEACSAASDRLLPVKTSAATAFFPRNILRQPRLPSRDAGLGTKCYRLNKDIESYPHHHLMAAVLPADRIPSDQLHLRSLFSDSLPRKCGVLCGTCIGPCCRRSGSRTSSVRTGSADHRQLDSEMGGFH